MRPRGRPAAFLDRDGTIIREREYLSDPQGVELLPGAVQGLRRLQEAGYVLVVVSNQSGIARGLYAEADYVAVQREMVRRLGDADVAIAGSYHCPHHPEFTGPCECRKPRPGLFERAARELGLDLARSVFIGDRLRDISAASRWGARAILVTTGYGREEGREAPQEVQVVRDLQVAAEAVLARPGGVDTPGRRR